LLNSYYKTIIEYPNACPANGNDARMQNTTNIANIGTNKYSINLYPNPNNGQMQIDYNIADDVNLEILDINGTLVDTYILKADLNTRNISNNKLSDGVYFYRIIKDNTVFQCQKLVIIK
jgi:triacylglycerol esterase/lipase EstA (alpha/beta hydrolase family)